MTDKIILNDEELSQVRGGSKDSNNILNELVVGDVISIVNYLMSGTYCLLKIDNGTYRFLEYSNEPYPDKGISISNVPEGATITKVGHDDEFVKRNLIGGMVF